MREKYYWRMVSLLPLLVPMISLISIYTRKSFVDTPGPPASVGQVFLLGSLFYGGIFYVIFIVITQAFIWAKPTKWDRRVSLIAPLIFLLLFLLGLQIYWVVTSSGSWFDNPRIFLISSLLVLILGYIYVGIAWGIQVILRSLRMLKEGVTLQETRNDSRPTTSEGDSPSNKTT